MVDGNACFHKRRKRCLQGGEDDCFSKVYNISPVGKIQQVNNLWKASFITDKNIGKDWDFTVYKCAINTDHFLCLSKWTGPVCVSALMANISITLAPLDHCYGFWKEINGPLGKLCLLNVNGSFPSTIILFQCWTEPYEIDSHIPPLQKKRKKEKAKDTKCVRIQNLLIFAI